MNYIFIDIHKGIERVGIVENNRLMEFYTDENDSKKIVGNIYRGRVVNILPGMEAAFVDIGEGKNAYLYVKDALPKNKKYSNERIEIDKIIKNGEEIIVQVLKEASENKGPKITTHITLPGRFIVLTPFSKSINISRKIDNEEEIERLKKIGQEIQTEDIGVIFRTKALNIEKEVLLKEYKALVNLYNKIERERNFLPCPKLIYKEKDLTHQILRDVFNDKIHRIITNDKNKYESLLELEDVFLSGLKERLYYDEDFNIDYQGNINYEIQTALSRKVPLKSGGHIIIDETEALTAIDVNTGKYIGEKNLEDTVLKTNLEAAEEIAIQIRLRDIGGIIIIDFIDMKNKKDVKHLLNKLDEKLSLDRNKANIIGITKLGLVEMTRKKLRNSLKYDFFETCPYCEGKGRVFSG